MHIFKNHERFYKGGKPFACSQCEEGFDRGVSLNRQERISHTGDKQFVCSYCDKSFEQNWSQTCQPSTRQRGKSDAVRLMRTMSWIWNLSCWGPLWILGSKKTTLKNIFSASLILAMSLRLHPSNEILSDLATFAGLTKIVITSSKMDGFLNGQTLLLAEILY